MKARFGITDGPIQHFCNFGVFVSLNVMENYHEFLERAELLQSTLQIEAVERARQECVGDGELLEMAGVIAFRIAVLLERSFGRTFLAHAHQSEIDGDTVQPGGESGIAAEGADFAKDHHESILEEILGLGGIAGHAQADGVDAGTVQLVEAFESVGTAMLSAGDGFFFG